MGKSPTGTSENTDEESEDEDSEIHPNQTFFDDHDSQETDDPDVKETSTSAAIGSGGGGGIGGGGGPVGDGAISGGEDAPEGGESEEGPVDEFPVENKPDEPPEKPEPTEKMEKADDDVDEQEQNEAEITVYTDPWDVAGWDNEPDLRRLQETFGDKLVVEYDILPARTIEEWESKTKMPTVDTLDAPESTANSYRALTAAKKQGLASAYLRRLRMAALTEGRDIETEDVLIELAEKVGLDIDQLREDMPMVEIENPKPIEETPQMQVTIADIPHFWTGNVEFGRVFGRMVGEGIQPEPIGRTIPKFVAKYEPAATVEVSEAFNLDQDHAVERLRQEENVMPRDFRSGTFWVSV